MSTVKVIGLAYLFLLSVIGLMAIIPILMQIANAQGTPTTIQGNSAGNLQFVPQQAYIYTQPPVGVQQQQQSDFGVKDLITALTAAATGGGLSGLYAKLRGDKTQKNVQDVAQTQVKITEVQQGTLEQVYENMANKGNEITNKPEIKLDNIKEIKQEALNTAAKT